MVLCLGLVVAVGVKGWVAEEFSGGGVDDADVEFVDEHDDVGSGVGSPDADVVECCCVAQGDGPGVSNDVASDPVVAVDVCFGGGGFGQGLIFRCWCLVGEGSVWAMMVVFIDERVDLVLELVEGCGFGLGGEPLFECLLEPFHLSAGGRVVRSAVFLDDLEVRQGAFEPVPSAFAASESGGVDHGVVGQYRCGEAFCFGGLEEFVDDDVGGDSWVGVKAGEHVDPARSGSLVHPDHVPVQEPAMPPGTGGGGGPGTSGPDGADAARQFYAMFNLDPVRGIKQLGEILEHVAHRLGSQVELVLEVRATSDEGFDETTQRVVKENASNLDSTAAEFE